MTERKFTRGLNKPGMAAQLRETVSQVVRESAVLSKPLVVEPIDYEAFVAKNKTVIQNDPQRELLIYPADDVSEIVMPRKMRTNVKSVADRFEPPNEAIVCPMHNVNGGSTTPNSFNGNGFGHTNSIDNGSNAQNGSTNGNDSRKNSYGSVTSKLSSAIKSPSSSYESSHSKPASNSSSSTTLKSNLAQPEIDDLDGLMGEAGGDDCNGTGNSVGTLRAECSRFTRQSLYTYRAKNHLIHYKYSAYGGTCHDLPNITTPSESFEEEVYEIDADPDRIDEQMTRSQADSIAKQGYLLKGPDSGSDRMFVNIGNKSFKRRYCYLRQEVDYTYILELHKDEKQGDAKATIVMDFCTEVVQNPKRGRFCFELRMTAGHKSFTLAAESEDDFNDWLDKLNSVLLQNKLQDEKRNASLERSPPPTQQQQQSNNLTLGTLKGLDQSMNPQLIKYGRETDTSIAQARTENRRRLFYSSQVKAALDDNVDQYREHFGKRFLITCKCLRFRLQCPIQDALDGSEHSQRQIEPYITSLALYDIKAGRKLTESFYFNINDENVNNLLPNTPVPGSVAACCIPRRDERDDKPYHSSQAPHSLFDSVSADLLRFPKHQFMHLKQCIFSISAPHPDIFVVLKIEKILQSNIVQAAEPYLKAGRDAKLGLKVHKSVRNCAQNIGHYRQPFAWAAKPLFRMYSNELDTQKNFEFEFNTLYRQDVQKIRDEELIKFLADYREKPEKFSKLNQIPGYFKLTIEEVERVPGSLSKSLAPLTNSSSETEPTLEICEFQSKCERDAYPYTSFCNHIYVYPLSLQFDSQKLFSRARNITAVIELRDSDNEYSKPLKCIYGRPGQDILVSQMACPVLHHNATPSWYEEIKMRLPLGLFPEHHLLFSFYHVSCNLSKKRDANSTFETPIGYAWLPLLQKGRINLEERTLPVAASLPVGYLSIQPLGLGKGNCGPEIQWIDSQRPLFAVGLRLDSTVITADQHLHNLFAHTERLLESGKTSALPAETETCKILKAAHAIDMTSLINYLPTILNELFTLLVHTQSEEIGLNVIRLLTNIIHMINEEANRKKLLSAYLKFVFYAPYYSQKTSRTVHGELLKHLPRILDPCNTDFLIVNKFMRYSSIFFDLIIKSMAQHLLSTGRIRMLRNERFPKDYIPRVENLMRLLVPYIVTRYKDLTEETKILNYSLAQFVRRCLTYMDRGFVFNLIRFYMEQFTPGDPRILQEYKFNFLQEICRHEHFIPLNLPFVLNPKNRPPEMVQHFTLSEDFCRQHFLSGLLLQELKSSLNEVSNVRRCALEVFTNLLAKHELDSRYQKRGQMARIALLYVPWLGIVMDNMHRIEEITEASTPSGHAYADSASYSKRLSCASNYVFSKDSSLNSITSTPRSKARMTMLSEHPSPFRHSVHIKETNYLAAIAGQMPMPNGISQTSLNSLNSDSLNSQDTNTICALSNDNHDDPDVSLRNRHNRSVSVTQAALLSRCDKFTSHETKDLLLGFLFIIKHLSKEQMIGWWQNCNETETLQFLSTLDLCLQHFRYVGKKNINLNVEGRSARLAKAHTLPSRTSPPTMDNGVLTAHAHHETNTLTHPQNREPLIDESERNHMARYESNLATEVGMVILDCLGLYVDHFKQMLSDSLVLPKLARVYLHFLQIGQSERLSSHVFAALRAFINNFSPTLFKGNAMLCGQMVFELLRACDCRLVQIRHESCAVLYLLMRSNFEFSGRKGLTRVHLQVIISVSQMIGNVIGLNNARFQESLSIINSYANSDKAMKGTGFPIEVKDLTRRVRTVLMATAQMQAHHMDPERLLQLQYSLANSYASTPELRHTWLVTMARNHEQNGNLSEAACCHLHIAALMCEYLQLCGVGAGVGAYSIKWRSTAFEKISRNIPVDEKGLKLDAGAQDCSQYTAQMLLEQLKLCAKFLDRAERFECLGELYKLILPFYERSRNYNELSHCYEHLTEAYNKIVDVNRSGKRMLGRFYRVVFYGILYFEEDHAIEYVYKEPKLTSLSEISERLAMQYKDKFGADVVKLIMDSSPVNIDDLDSKLAYIQVTHVIPFFTKEELDQRLNEFEQNHDVDTFMYETPFTKTGTTRGSIKDQWKRKTVIKTQYSFPYVLKRIPVKSREIIELSPIEVAIDEMQSKLSELEEVILPPPDVKKLQLRLQGSVAVTVNAGPLAYAQAFLDAKVVNGYSVDRVEDLKDVFRDFMAVCHTALKLNERMISPDQKEYHNALKENYEKLVASLSELLDESLQPLVDIIENPHRNSMALFNAISGASHNSSTA